MGSGGSQTPSTLPPPPQPVIKYDPATTAAEAALAGAAKDSYASRTETEEEKEQRASLGQVQPVQSVQSAKPMRKPKSAATMMTPAGNMGAAAIVTG